MPASKDWAEITLTGLVIFKARPTTKEWERSWDEAVSLRQSSAWLIGDLYNAGEFMGEQLHQFIKAEAVSLHTIQNHASVCKAYAYDERMYPPSFSHHEVVAKLKPARRRYWLKRCVKESLDVNELREMTAEERGVEIKDKPSGRTKVAAGVRMAIQGCDEMGLAPEATHWRDILTWVLDQAESISTAGAGSKGTGMSVEEGSTATTSSVGQTESSPSLSAESPTPRSSSRIPSGRSAS
jgi:hypothetical protein